MLMIKSMDDFEVNPYSRMDNVFRFSDTKLIERESDLHHVGAMIFLSMCLIDDLRSFYKNDDLINEELLFTKIIHHDLNEIVDIPRSMKYYTPEFKSIVEKVSDQMMLDYGLPQSRLDKVHSAKNDDTLEAELCKLVDMLQCNTKLRQEFYLQRTPTMKMRYIESLKNTIKNFNGRINNPLCESIKLRLMDYRDLIQKELGKIETMN